MPRSRVSIAFRLLKRLVVALAMLPGDANLRKVSIAFRLLKRLVVARRKEAQALRVQRSLNCLSAVEAIGRCVWACARDGNLPRSQLPFGC